MKGSVILVWSKKQKICTKDSTEAEMVSVLDFPPIMEWVKDFIMGQGAKISETVLYQDNTLTMQIVENPQCGKLHTRYTKARAGVANGFVFVRGVTKMEHMKTDLMLADVVKKPLGVALFEIFEDRLMNAINHEEFTSRIIVIRKDQQEGTETPKILAATLQEQGFGSRRESFSGVKLSICWTCNGQHGMPSCGERKSDERRSDGFGSKMGEKDFRKVDVKGKEPTKMCHNTVAKSSVNHQRVNGSGWRAEERKESISVRHNRNLGSTSVNNAPRCKTKKPAGQETVGKDNSVRFFGKPCKVSGGGKVSAPKNGRRRPKGFMIEEEMVLAHIWEAPQATKNTTHRNCTEKCKYFGRKSVENNIPGATQLKDSPSESHESMLLDCGVALEKYVFLGCPRQGN